MLERIKRLLGLKDDKKDELLSDIIELCKSPIINYIEENSIPPQLEWLLVESVIVRYNRINSEGFNSESIDGGSISYRDDFFEANIHHLDSYIAQKEKRKKGVRFL